MSDPSPPMPIPASWKVARLGDIANTTSGGTPSRDYADNYGGSIPWVKSGELGDSIVFATEERITEKGLATSSAKVFPEGTLCIALYGATIGKLGILGIAAATNQAVCAIFPPDGVDRRFLFRFLEYKRPKLIEQGKGGAQPNISQGIVREIPLPIAPSNEQQRIVDAVDELLSEVEAGVEALKRLQVKLKHYRAAALKAAVEGSLTANWREQHPDTESASELLKRILTERRRRWEEEQLAKFKAANKQPPKDWQSRYKEPKTAGCGLARVPMEWVCGTLEQLTDATAPVLYGILQPGPCLEQGVPYVRPTEIVGDRIDLAAVRNTTPEIAARYGRSQLATNDVVLSIVGTIGKVAVVPDCLAGGNITQSSVRIRAVRDLVRPKYLAWALRSAVLTEQFDRKRLGTAVPRLNVEDVRLLVLPLPPLEEQDALIEVVEEQLAIVEHLVLDIEAKLLSAQALRKSILRHAFTGQLVPQDPKDEPASELLKRIAAERDARAGASSKKPRSRANAALRD